MDEHQEKTTETIEIKTRLAERVRQVLGENVYLCYQCVKCTSGCPLADYFDWQPNQVMRAVQLGDEEIALHAQTPWLCASCQTCTTRCPQGLDISTIMAFLTREALAQGISPPVTEVNTFNQAFLREVRLWGRAYEPGMMVEMKLRNPRSLFDDMDFYARMLKKRKVAILPRRGQRPHHIQPHPQAGSAVAYYPGCSLHSTSTEFDRSARTVCKALDIELVEPHGWVCCGSSPAHRSDPEAALRLPMENLSLIEEQGFAEVTMPCAACFNRHKAAIYEIRHDSEKKAKIDAALGYDYQDRVQISTLVDAIMRNAGEETVSSRVSQPLNGLKVVCYYGCLLTRPPAITEAPHPENPTDMDTLMAALGAEVLDWSYKTSCCGATHALTRPDIVLRLSGSLIEHASEAGAEAIVVACPLCHTNLDARQFQMDVQNPMPVLFFSQLMALAFGLSEDQAVLQKNMVDPRPLLYEKGILNPG